MAVGECQNQSTRSAPAPLVPRSCCASWRVFRAKIQSATRYARSRGLSAPGSCWTDSTIPNSGVVPAASLTRARPATRSPVPSSSAALEYHLSQPRRTAFARQRRRGAGRTARACRPIRMQGLRSHRRLSLERDGQTPRSRGSRRSCLRCRGWAAAFSDCRR